MDALTQGFTHRSILSSGHRIHLVEHGPADGTPIVMIHGFPESWYSWRHQLRSLGDAGHRAVAIDVRGYGRSAAPADIEAYAMTALVGDVIAVIDDLTSDLTSGPAGATGGDGAGAGGPGAGGAVVVGHDWGAPIAWNTALLRPDRVLGVAGLSVPYSGRGDVRPLAAFRAMAAAAEDGARFYIDHFQTPGLIEAEVEQDLAGWLRGFYFTASAEGDHAQPSMAMVPAGGELRDRLQQPGPGQMAWMTDDDFAFYLGEFERTGLTGGFNRYRNVERDWTELAPWRHAPITVPALFIGGDRDGPTMWGRPAIERFDQTLPRLTRSVILEDCGHWTQQEQPERVDELLAEFVAGLARP